MVIDFNKLVEFNNKHPDSKMDTFLFIFINLLASEETTSENVHEFILDYTNEEEIYENLQNLGLIKIIGPEYKDVSIRDLGLELIGQSKSDTVIELAEKIRDLFPKGVKSGGYLVRSSIPDIADKLRKFFKKHKYTQEQVLEATQRYVRRKANENYAYMQQAHFFIEKNNASNLASECENVKESNSDGITFVDNTDRL